MKRIFKLPRSRLYWVWDDMTGGYWSEDQYGSNCKEQSHLNIKAVYGYGGIELFTLPEYLQVDTGL